MHVDQRINLCPVAALQITSELSSAAVRQADESGRYDAMAQIETTVSLQARSNPVAFLLKKPAGLDTEWSKSVSVSVSSADTQTESGSRVPQERKIAAEAMFRLLSKNCLKCPLKVICPNRESIGKDARLNADTSQQL